MPRHKKHIDLIILLLLAACSAKDGQRRNDVEDSTLDGIGPVAQGCDGAVCENWETSEFVLPYPVGKTYSVTLSHCGGSYHSSGQPDAYAIDFNLDIGETITASRAGKAVYVEESGRDGAFPNNLVIVEHSDNTFAQYIHLTFEGALVEIDQEIKQGDIIGLSGNTGLAGFSHLHLVMTREIEYPYEFFPVTFKNTLSNERSLASGIAYPAFEYEPDN